MTASRRDAPTFPSSTHVRQTEASRQEATVLILDVPVEISQGERNKYEVDHDTHRIRLNRTPFTSTQYAASGDDKELCVPEFDRLGIEHVFTAAKDDGSY